jgi:hypothetical protein
MFETGAKRILSGDDWVCHVVYTDDTTKTVFVDSRSKEERAVWNAANYVASMRDQVKSVTAARRCQVDPHYREAKRQDT